MKTIALISGGKDSVLSILAAWRFGHEPSVLLNVAPQQESACAGSGTAGTDADIDSYMFQTVGHEAVEAIAECFGLPLRRFTVRRGSSKDLSMRYSPAHQTTPGDEVEQLFEALSAVVKEFPDVEGVTSGAILSNYQRYRVEEVCGRLGLRSLAYLWQRRASEVLDMAAAWRVRAILVKTASVGLEPTKLLGKSLEQARPVLQRMENLYGSHMAGEGGEFETIVLDCPLFREKCLSVVSSKLVMVDDNDYAPCGFSVLSVQTVPKSAEDAAADAAVLENLRSEHCTFPSDSMIALPQETLFIHSGTRDAVREVKSVSAFSQFLLDPPHSLLVHALRREATLPLVTGETETTPGSWEASLRVLLSEMLHDFTVQLRGTSGAGDAPAESPALPHSLPVFVVVQIPRLLLPCFYSSWDSLFVTTTPPARAVFVSDAVDTCSPCAVLDFFAPLTPTAASEKAGTEGADTTTGVDKSAPLQSSVRHDVLYSRSVSHWAAGSPHTTAQAVQLEGVPSEDMTTPPANRRSVVTGLVAGLNPLTWKVVDETAAVYQQIPTSLSAADRGLAAQFAYAYANCMAYLRFFRVAPTDVTHAVFVFARGANTAMLHDLWHWCAGTALESSLGDGGHTVIQSDASSLEYPGSVVQIALQCTTSVSNE